MVTIDLFQLVECCSLTEHIRQVCRVVDIPVFIGLVQTDCLTKQSFNDCDYRDSPAANRLVEMRAIVELSAV